MTTREDILLLCPFCGGRGDIEGADYDGPADCWDTLIACNDCDARGPSVLREHGDSRSAAIDDAYAAWNRRAAPTPAAAEAPGQEPVAVKGVDSQVMVAATQLDDDQKRNPQWLWYGDEARDVSLGRWQRYPSQAPYVRADLVSAPPTYADAEAKGFEKAAKELDLLGAEYNMLWNDNVDPVITAVVRTAMYRAAEHIRSLASPAPKGET